MEARKMGNQCLSRRQILASGASGALGALLFPAAVMGASQSPHLAPTPPTRGLLSNEGCGMYTDMSDAQHLSSFTINPSMVSCAVCSVAQGQHSRPLATLVDSPQGSSYLP